VKKETAKREKNVYIQIHAMRTALVDVGNEREEGKGKTHPQNCCPPLFKRQHTCRPLGVNGAASFFFYVFSLFFVLKLKLKIKKKGKQGD
jgi:hypothetical protein